MFNIGKEMINLVNWNY